MTPQVVVFRATLADESALPAHERMATAMRQSAAAVDGFVEWRDALDGLIYWGHAIFESEEAARAWPGDPRHGGNHDHAELGYTEFSTHAYASVRGVSWRPDRGSDDG